MRFHYVGMPHLPVAKKYCPCAFTQKVHKLTRMLLGKGHEVFLYGVGYTDIKHPRLKFIPVVAVDDVVDAWGEGDNRFEIGYNWPEKGFKHDINQKPTACTTKFRIHTITMLLKEKRPDDFLLLSQGYYQKVIDDAVKLYLTCEPGIGYRGSYCDFRAFESAYIQNFTYGSEHPRESINGHYYDRVIPNYFDLDDFKFGEKPENYLFYMGRVIPRKGVETAMRVADHLKTKLFIAGQGSLRDIDYKSKYAKHLGTLDVDDRKLWLSQAKVTLVPTLYLEPFGGVAVESMISGTPAVTTNFGVFPETVKNGISGYRCDTLDDFVENTKKAMTLDRKKVREWGLNYSMENVNELYEKWWQDLYRVYQSTVDSSKKAWHYVK